MRSHPLKQKFAHFGKKMSTRSHCLQNVSIPHNRPHRIGWIEVNIILTGQDQIKMYLFTFSVQQWKEKGNSCNNIIQSVTTTTVTDSNDI